jgi:hypothetical protein
MKKIFRKLKKVSKQITDLKSELLQMDDSAYYNGIGKHLKERDKTEIQIQLKQLLSTKYGLLDSMTQAVNLEKSDVSYEERKIIINHESI